MRIRGKAAERLQSQQAPTPPGPEEASTVLGQRIFGRASRHAAPPQGPDPSDDAEGGVAGPVDADHLEDLEEQMDLLRVAIDLEGPADLGGPRAGRLQARESFVAHFAELGAALEEWDAIVERVQAAPGSVWDWFGQVTSERGFTEPPFAIGPLIDLLSMLTVKRARYGRLETPDRLQIQSFESTSTQGTHANVYVEGQNIAQLPAEPAETVPARVAAVAQRVQELFDDAQASAEAEEVVSARDELLAAKQPLLDLLALHASADEIVSATGCPRCRERLEQGAPA
jgi:hypothetical protein